MKTCPICRSTYPNDFTVCPRDAAPLVDGADWSEGAVIRGKYRILGKVGQGGMGAVYKALHTKFDQVRALKVMTGDLAADPEFVKRFEREAVLMSRLQHPNVVRVDDIDEAEDGRPFIVMEFVEGRSLRHVIKEEGPLLSSRVCSIARQAAAGLGAAHQLGMVHRDVKPENIVLIDSPEGEKAKVLDFGIAKLKEAQLGDGLQTATGVVIGTPQYLSPEQAMGKRSEDLDGRSDLYSLGLVIYQMLTCDLPFQADSAVGWMLARLNESPRPLRTARPDLAIPDALANLVMRCLEKNRDLRPADAAELIRELDRVEGEINRPAESAPAPEAAMTPTLPATPGVTRVTLPLQKITPGATSTSPWARGWRFWAGLAAFALMPMVLGPLYDLSPYADRGMPLPALFTLFIAAMGISAWWLLTRRHWGFRLAGILPFALFALLLGIRTYNIFEYMPPWGAREVAATIQLYPIEELKRASRSPIELTQAIRGFNDQTQQVVFHVELQNISSDAAVTDWKVDALDFDFDGKLLSDASPVNRTPFQIDPGKTVNLDLSGPDYSKVKTIKMVFSEVAYEVTSPGGSKVDGKWINSHYQDDLQRAKQP